MKNSMNISLSPVLSDYELLDSGDFEKLERFGRYVTRRPEPQAIWHRSLTEEELKRYRERFAEIEDISPQEVQTATGFFFCAM